MSGSTTTDEGETIEVSMGVVSSCSKGEVSYQYCKRGNGILHEKYFVIIRSSGFSARVLPCPSTPISSSSVHSVNFTECIFLFVTDEVSVEVPEFSRHSVLSVTFLRTSTKEETP
jgi:hypothetical protein